ncbi:metallophosphoesterase [Pyrococcus sp. ST04]|uniref:metallophosphoesterase n=1 Tax=Pyrococcus sp. ST04 TaxID=1183377 RepID=UPI0002605B33|nr:metallophosphoesterase [Pyrococcus sp. ST04]AFK22848.1 putative Metallophosphoesterase, calcineurin superfamily [Pyrococcus sp. ST04]
MKVRFLPSKGVLIGKALIIADTHIGFEESMIKEGAYIPKLLREMIASIVDLIKTTNAKTLVINGDLKHSFTPERREFIELSTFFESISSYLEEIVLVRGNHDTGISWIKRFEVEIVDRITVHGWDVFHGHLKLDYNKAIIGHEHPSIRLRDEVGATLKVPIFLKAKDLIVLPAFSPWAYGNDLTINEPISPVLKERNLDNFEILIPVDDEILNFGRFRDLIEAIRKLSGNP